MLFHNTSPHQWQSHCVEVKASSRGTANSKCPVVNISCLSNMHLGSHMIYRIFFHLIANCAHHIYEPAQLHSYKMLSNT